MSSFQMGLVLVCFTLLSATQYLEEHAYKSLLWGMVLKIRHWSSNFARNLVFLLQLFHRP